MRLLIYGGNEQNIRCKIGNWDLAELAPLSDLYSVPQEGWTIGLGLLQNEPFLFLKRRQVTGTRLYPFSILYSPSRATWKKFNWNAANLALTLLEENNEYSTILLNNPENLTVHQLDLIDQSLQPFEIKASPNLYSNLITGSLTENEIVSFNPSLLGLNFPTLPTLAENLEAIPAFARCGSGWLFGGSTEHAKYLGINLVFDANLQKNDNGKKEILNATGNKFIDSWEIAQHNARLKSETTKFANLPSIFWETEENQSPSEFLTNLQTFGTVSNLEKISEADYQSLSQTKGVFSEEIKRIAAELISQNLKPISAQNTASLLTRVDAKLQREDSLPIEQLDRTTYLNWLAQQQKFPSQVIPRFQFDEKSCFELCHKIIENEADVKKIPDLFRHSIDEMKRLGADGYLPHLSNTVYEKTYISMLDVWRQYHKEAFFKEYLADKFSIKARKITLDAINPEWTEIYLRFADDEGGKWMNEEVKPAQITGFFEAVFKAKTIGVALTNWLSALVHSPLRKKLPNQYKKQIATLNQPQVQQSWINFSSLINILEGEKPVIKTLKNSAEREFLELELGNFFKEKTDLDLEKIKAPLKTFFGEYPKSLVEEFSQRGLTLKGQPFAKVEAESPSVSPDELEQMSASAENNREIIKKALKDEESRRKLLEHFGDSKKSPLYAIFPFLPIDLRSVILHFLLEEDERKLKDLAVKLFKDNQFSEFSLALWECVLTTEIGGKIGQLMKGKLGGGRDLDNELRGFINRSIAIKQEEYPKHKQKVTATEPPEKKEGLFTRFFNYLKFLFGADKNNDSDDNNADDNNESDNNDSGNDKEN